MSPTTRSISDTRCPGNSQDQDDRRDGNQKVTELDGRRQQRQPRRHGERSHAKGKLRDGHRLDRPAQFPLQAHDTRGQIEWRAIVLCLWISDRQQAIRRQVGFYGRLDERACHRLAVQRRQRRLRVCQIGHGLARTVGIDPNLNYSLTSNTNDFKKDYETLRRR
jgi:hypothetical protein